MFCFFIQIKIITL